MGVVTRTAEARSSKMTAAQLYKSMFIDMDKVMPKILPQIFKSVRLVEGDGGVGTVKEITYGEGIYSLYFEIWVIRLFDTCF